MSPGVLLPAPRYIDRESEAAEPGGSGKVVLRKGTELVAVRSSGGL